MTLPERFSDLPEYAFPRLRALLDAYAPGGDVMHMSIGEPRHAFPGWVAGIIASHAEEFGRYPPNAGLPELLEAIAGWIFRRYGIKADPGSQIIALNGTREGLFNACLALCPGKTRFGGQPAVLMPNPFYQVYAAAALAVGAEAICVPATRGTGFLPDYAGLPPELLDRAEIAYLCSPSNPQGAVASSEYLAELIALAERHEFIVLSDECYSEIYAEAPPAGCLRAASESGASPERVMVFNSLSKRSSAPGLRSGFAAGGAESIAAMKRLRAYAGAPLPLPLQRAAEKLWEDEAHVEQSRILYRDKHRMAREAFADVPGFQQPEGGFFLWLPVGDGEEAAIKLWSETGIRVLPGAYLGRDVDGANPGKEFVRAAMVAPKDELRRGIAEIKRCFYS